VLFVDANVLLYAVNQDAHHHVSARSWLDGALGGEQTVALAWTVLLSFVRISTLSAAFPAPLSAAEACGAVEAWVRLPAVVTPEPTQRHASLLAGLLDEAGTAGNLVADAHLAALAVEHGGTIASYDRDFGRFVGVRLIVPS